MSDYSRLSKETLVVLLERSQIRVGELENVRRELVNWRETNTKYLKMGQDFETLINAVKSNPVTGHAWEKLLVSMRMTGMDGNDK